MRKLTDKVKAKIGWVHVRMCVRECMWSAVDRTLPSMTSNAMTTSWNGHGDDGRRHVSS